MSKALIITLYGNYNYGNRFQAYAMQKVLRKYIEDVSTLANSKTVSKITMKPISKLLPNLTLVKEEFLKRNRVKGFEAFTQKNIKECTCEDAEILNKEFDIVCIGSDQIWNPYGYNNFFYAYGKFHKNVFAYSGSIGRSEVSDIYKKEMKSGLEHIKNISVREDKGADIVEELIGERPEVLLDPTMLLTTDEWDEVIEKPKKMPKKKYIMTYFLGDYSEERKKYIKGIAKKNNAEIINLAQLDDNKYYCINPGEFIYLLKNCEAFFTDSFHGAVFSILYKKVFFLLEREGKHRQINSRMETLLKKFELEGRTIANYSQEIEFNCDFSKIDEVLKIEREKSRVFLEKAINV